MSEKIFTEKELDALLSSAIPGGANDEECQKLVEWATRIRVSNSILQQVLTGKYIVSVREDGEPRCEGNRTPKHK